MEVTMELVDLLLAILAGQPSPRLTAADGSRAHRG
jgi:hypothetical protein